MGVMTVTIFRALSLSLASRVPWAVSWDSCKRTRGSWDGQTEARLAGWAEQAGKAPPPAPP